MTLQYLGWNVCKHLYANLFLKLRRVVEKYLPGDYQIQYQCRKTTFLARLLDPLVTVQVSAKV